MKNVTEKLSRGAFWITATRIGVNLLGIVSVVLLTRLLQPSDFGLVAIATAVFSIVTAMTSMSLSMALIQVKDPVDDHYHTAWTLQLLRGLIIAVVLAIVAFPTASAYDDPRLVNVFFGLAVGTFLSGLSSPHVAALQRGLVFRQEFISALANRLAALAASLSIALYFHSYWALVVGPIAGQIATTIVTYWVAPYSPRFKLTKWRDLLSFSVNLTFSSIVNALNYRVDQLVVGSLGKEQLGYYTVGGDIASLATREATAPITQVLFPGMVAIAGDKVRLRKAVENAMTVCVAWALPVGVGFAMVADPVVRLFMGEKWAPMIYIVQALAALYGLQSIMTVAPPLAMATGRTGALLRRDILFLCVRLPLTVGGLMLGGLPGAVYARVVLGLFHVVITLRLVEQVVAWPILRQIASTWRSLLAAAAMALALSLLREFLPTIGRNQLIIALAVEIVVGGIVYVGIHVLAWIACGRPQGAETSIYRIASSVLKR